MRHYITLDIETPYDSDYSLEKLTYEQYIRDERFRINILGIKVDAEPACYYSAPADIKVALERWFSPGNNNVMICHSTLYDGAAIAWRYGLYAAEYWCTEAMSRALWNQRSAALAEVAKRCFPRDKTKRKGEELANFKGILRVLTAEENVILGGYCNNDVELTFACLQKMHPWLPETFFDIMGMSLKMFILPGFKLNVEAVTTYKTELENAREAAIDKSQLPQDILASNDKFAAWILAQGIPFEKIPSPTPTKPDNMKWPLAKNAEEFIELQTEYPQHEAVWDARLLVKSTLELRRCERMLDHRDKEGRISLALKISAAHTHRFGGTNKLNGLNLKRGSPLRRALCAPDGHYVGVVDSSQIERRLVAWQAGEESMLQAFREDRDIYSEFASVAFGRPINKDDDPLERFSGKTCELGLQYQMGAPRLRKSFATGQTRLYYSLPECENFVRVFRGRNPRTQHLWGIAHGWVHAMAEKGTKIDYKCLQIQTGRILLPNGLYLNYPGLRAIENARGGYDFEYWQGRYFTNLYGGKVVENTTQALAQAVLWWQMLKIAEYLETIGGRIVLQVHDEIVFFFPRRLDPEVVMKTVSGFMKLQPDWLNDGTLVLDVEGGFASDYSK